jgi:hypothetical protein
MTAPNRKTEETTETGDPLISRIPAAKPSTTAGQADAFPLEPDDFSGRKLRNRFIVANAIAWIVIIFLIRLTFF